MIVGDKISEQDKNIEYEEISKGKQIEKLIDNCAETITNIPKERIEQLKTRYKSDSRAIVKLKKKYLHLQKKLKWQSNL